MQGQAKTQNSSELAGHTIYKLHAIRKEPNESFTILKRGVVVKRGLSSLDKAKKEIDQIGIPLGKTTNALSATSEIFFTDKNGTKKSMIVPISILKQEDSSIMKVAQKHLDKKLPGSRLISVNGGVAGQSPDEHFQNTKGDYTTYEAWKRAVKAAGATRFDGDKDIANAFKADGQFVGEWDGAHGYLDDRTKVSNFANGVAKATEYINSKMLGNNSSVEHIDHTRYPESLKTKSESALRYIIKDAQEALKAMPNGPKAGYYQDEVNYAVNELNRRKKLNNSQLSPSRMQNDTSSIYLSWIKRTLRETGVKDLTDPELRRSLKDEFAVKIAKKAIASGQITIRDLR